MAVKPVPDGYRTITPYLAVKGAARLIDFLKRAFEATEINRAVLPDGSILNAELRIGDSMIMLADARGDQEMPCVIYL